MSEATIDVPAAGPIKKTWVYAGLAGVALIVGYAYWKRRNSEQAAPVEPPIEDYTGGVQTGSSGSTTAGLNMSYESGPTSGDPSTNAEWTQRAVDALANVGFDPQFAALTLGKFLASQPLNSQEADLVRTAQGLVGRPPVGDIRVILIGTNNTPAPGGSSGPSTVPAPLHTNLYDWSSGQGITLTILRALNPWLDTQHYITWTGPEGSSKIPTLERSTPDLRIR